MVITLAERRKLIQAGLGKFPLDLLINNVQIVNVHTGRIEPGAIGIVDGRIVTGSPTAENAFVLLDASLASILHP